MAIKAIAMDIDGTLTNDQKVISPRTREKLLAAQESGIKLILASGRPAWGLHALAQELDLQNHDGLLVAFNGAHVVDAQTDEVLFDQAMPADELHRLIDHLRNFDVIPMISLGRDLHVEDSYHCMITLPDGSQKNIVKYERDACDLKIREVESLHEVVDAYPVDKLLTAGDPAYLQAHYEEMYAPLPRRFRACLRLTGTLSTRRPVSTRPARLRAPCPSSASMPAMSYRLATARTTSP